VKISRNAFWQVGVFRIIIALCILFFLLTIIAMLLYPGGTMVYPHTQGYSFFLNFFSDLGRTVTPSGLPNFASSVLFTLALATVAPGLALFFIAFTRFFPGLGMPWRLSWLGTACGSVTSLCFIAAAFLPTNLYRHMHNLCVNAAFLMFLIAVVLLFLAILLQPGFPRRFAWIFGFFLVLLASYILLLIFGPAARTPAGEIIQATGQKIIVYASILTILIQALSVQPLLLKSVKSQSIS
jgi:hypothetical protein